MIPRENAKSKRWRRIPFRGNERLTEILQRRRFLGDESFVFGDWETGAFVKDFRKAWEHVVLLSAGVRPVVVGRHKGLTTECRCKLADIDLHFHDLRHEGLSRYGEGGMPLRELQELAGHANPQTTVRYEHVGGTRPCQLPLVARLFQNPPSIVHNLELAREHTQDRRRALLRTAEGRRGSAEDPPRIC